MAVSDSILLKCSVHAREGRLARSGDRRVLAKIKVRYLVSNLESCKEVATRAPYSPSYPSDAANFTRQCTDLAYYVYVTISRPRLQRMLPWI